MVHVEAKTKPPQVSVHRYVAAIANEEQRNDLRGVARLSRPTILAAHAAPIGCV
jgi:hypothetical protein